MEKSNFIKKNTLLKKCKHFTVLICKIKNQKINNFISFFIVILFNLKDIDFLNA